MFDFDSSLFWYKLVFIAELLLIEMLFTYKLKKRTHFPLRLTAMIATCFVATFLFPILFYNAAYSSAMFTVLFAVTMVTLKFVYDEPWRVIVFGALAAYTTQHLAYEVYTFFILAFGLDNGASIGAYSDDGDLSSYTPWTALVYGASYAVVYWLMFLFFGDRITGKDTEARIGSVKLIALSGCVIFVNIVLNAVVTYNSQINYDTIYLMTAHVSNILCCIFAILLQFGIFARKRLENELFTISQLWAKDKEQYHLSKETIDTINLKCHDLRHQIREIGNRRVLDESVIKEIESTIQIYDSAVKTGNEALDVVLTEKSLQCSKNAITFSCVADGKSFDFMSPSDIYSLFGNALENAVEAVTSISDQEKRLINLVIHRSGSLLSIRLDNCTDKEVKIINGMPVTDKADKQYHGFGTKSIRAIAEKYGGDLSFSFENGLFSMKLMFPIPSGNVQDMST